MNLENTAISPHENIHISQEVLMADTGVEAMDEAREQQQDAEEIPEDVDQPDGGDEGDEPGDLVGAEARVLPDPGEPTPSQVEDHRACGHVPYRSWCDECVQGRATGEQHRARKGER